MFATSCYSLIDSRYVLNLIQNNYHINNDINVSLLNKGDNDHYLVTSGQKKFVFRIYKHNKHWLQNESDYLFELNWLEFLRNNKLPVSFPIKNNNERYLNVIEAIEGKRFGVLFSYAAGEMREINPEISKRFGKIVGKIHVLSNQFQPERNRNFIDEHFLIDIPLERIKNFLNEKKNEYLETFSFFQEKAKSDINKFKVLIDNDEWGVIGGDFHINNYIYTKNNKITLFDFDLCGYGWRAYDLAVYKWSLSTFCNGKPLKDAALLWKAFLEGYSRQRKLSDRELEIIPTFVKVRQLWLIGSHMTYSEIPKTQEYFEKKFMAF